jgi:hypothetical protein
LHIVCWFNLRWQLEVTFHEVRAHLGVETQRQWSARAILRTTPALMGLYSFVTLLAHEHLTATPPADAVHQTAWYVKTTLTFSDARALVRRHLWTHSTFPISPWTPGLIKVPAALFDQLTDLLCYAA